MRASSWCFPIKEENYAIPCLKTPGGQPCTPDQLYTRIRRCSAIAIWFVDKTDAQKREDAQKHDTGFVWRIVKSRSPSRIIVCWINVDKCTWSLPGRYTIYLKLCKFRLIWMQQAVALLTISNFLHLFLSAILYPHCLPPISFSLITCTLSLLWK